MSQSPPDPGSRRIIFDDEFSQQNLPALSRHAESVAEAIARQAEAAANVAAATAYIRNVYGGAMTLHLHTGSSGGSGITHSHGGSGGGGYPAGGGGGGGGGGGYPAWGGGGGSVAVTPGITYGWAGGGNTGSGGNGYARSGPRPQRGMDGFDGADVAVGTVRGYRWWALDAPELAMPPHTADEHWPAAPLRGARDEWQPGMNTARCLTLGAHDPELTPLLECGCGFWGYWHRQNPQISGDILVEGVIEGSGNVLTGPLGFRCSDAKIVALCLGASVEPGITYARTTDILRKYLPGSRVYGDGEELTAPLPDDPLYQEARDWAQAWTAVISDRLAVMYPQARVFETDRLMAAEFRPDENYAHRDACPYCGYSPGSGRYHQMFCPMRP